MGLLDIISGGKSHDAESAMKRAEAAFSGIKTPTIAELTLPELQKYVEAGILTPAQAKAVLVEKNAYDTANIPTAGRDAQISALNRLEELGANGGKDAQSEASLQDTISKMNTATAGQRGAIQDSFAQRGIPLSLAAGAMQNTYLGQDAAQANKNALQANADAEMRALQAIENAGSLGGNVQAQDWNQANTKAQAQNTINAWNSQVANNVANANAGRQQDANAYNAQNKQNVSNANVENANKRTAYNTNLPNTVFQNQLQKASGQSGAAANAANLYNDQGKQTSGFISGVIGATAPMISKGFSGPAAGSMAANGGSYNPNIGYNDLPFSEGGIVPGEAKVPGDSPENDTVSARLSPGELVVPRSLVHDFVKNMPKKHAAPHPEDIAHTLAALTAMRHSVGG